MSSQFHTDPSLSDACVRSRLLANNGQLEPPALLPAMFSCDYKGVPAVGVVCRNGSVMLMPDRCSYEAGPCVWDTLRAVEADSEITNVRWDLCVTRLAE